jgi:BirA family transcriptional regulator, biotin operon repressor / biotin---[acetyl-CoA-carboxylase] ligase
MISAQRIAELCLSSVTPVAIEVVAETGSTNSDLLSRVSSLSMPTLLVAESQTQGRGRAGRVWLSAPGASLTFSLAWKFRQQVQALAGLPLAVGVAVAQALDAYDVRTTLKWPNDILKDGNKLGGILIETSVVHDGVWSVIGIGLNLALPDSLEDQIGQPVSESVWLAQVERNALLATLLDRLSTSLVIFESEGFYPFNDIWNRLHAHAGLPVSIADNNRILFEGIATGVDNLGRLLLDTTSGQIVVVAGDVSLRAMEG